jgi:hypothetical protein
VQRVRTVILCLLLSGLCRPGLSQTAGDVIGRFLEQHNRFAAEADVRGNYTLDLNVEAILFYTRISGDSSYLVAVENFFRNRRYQFSDTVSYRRVPFADAWFEWFLFKQDSAFIAPYVYESYRMRDSLRRSPEGAVCINHQGGHYLLIDYLQQYAARMARAGHLSGDSSFFRECVHQFALYRAILRDPGSGLYRQGRGWLADPQQLSPACWSRGQGWLLRGMVNSLEYLPPGSPYAAELKCYLVEFADALLAVQDRKGMWHTLPCLPHAESYPEVSGTGMIARYLAVAIRNGFLQGAQYRRAVRNALRGLETYRTPDGWSAISRRARVRCDRWRSTNNRA